MVDKRFHTTGVERFFGDDEIIVSKTNLKGAITYANSVFMTIADYTQAEVVGKSHNMIRHPDMPRSVFKLLWDTVQGGEEIFAYVMNRAKNGDHYWVIAHVTPSRNKDGDIVGYHSNRRVPNRRALDEFVVPLYRNLKKIEDGNANAKEGLKKSYESMLSAVEKAGLPYDALIFRLEIL